MFKTLVSICLLCAPAIAGTWRVDGVTPSQSASGSDTLETVLYRGSFAAGESIYGLLNLGAWGYLQMGSWAGPSSIDERSCGARQAGKTDTGSSQTIGSMAFGAQQIGYVQAGTRSIGTDSYGANQTGYNSGTQTIAAATSGALQIGNNRTVYTKIAIQTIAEGSAGAMQIGENYGGKQTISSYAIGAGQFGVNNGVQTIGARAFGSMQIGWNDGNCQAIGEDSIGARQSGYNLGSQVIGNNVAGASQQGFVAAWASATNNGVGAMQILELFNGEHALTTSEGAASLLLGAGVVSHKNAIVAGNGGHSHGDGSITATGGFFGNATSASVVTGSQSNTLKTALQPGATNALWIAMTNLVTNNNLQLLTYPKFIIPLDGYSDFEIFASTNNFRTLLYWYDSVGPSSCTNFLNSPIADLNAQLYYCNPDKGSPWPLTAWILHNPNTSLAAEIGGNNNYQNTVILIPSMTTQGTNKLNDVVSTWMYPSNNTLVWSYRFRTSTGDDTNALGRLIWHPLIPVEWSGSQMDVKQY